jgi:hypothetical protein
MDELHKPICLENQHRDHPNTHERYKVSPKPLIASFGKVDRDACW